MIAAVTVSLNNVVGGTAKMLGYQFQPLSGTAMFVRN